MQGCVAAFQFLSFFSRFFGNHQNDIPMRAAIPFFSFVGFVFGVILMLLNRVLEPYLASEILSVTLVIVLALLTGAVHLEGAAKLFGSFATGAASENKESRGIGFFGLLAVIFIILLKLRAIEVTSEIRDVELVLTPIFSRWVLVLFAFESTPAGEGPANKLTENVTTWHLVLASLISLSLAGYLMGRTGLWIAFWLSLFALAARAFLHRRLGGVTCDSFGAVVELSEALALILFASS